MEEAHALNSVEEESSAINVNQLVACHDGLIKGRPAPVILLSLPRERLLLHQSFKCNPLIT